MTCVNTTFSLFIVTCAGSPPSLCDWASMRKNNCKLSSHIKKLSLVFFDCAGIGKNCKLSFHRNKIVSCYHVFVLVMFFCACLFWFPNLFEFLNCLHMFYTKLNLLHTNCWIFSIVSNQGTRAEVFSTPSKSVFSLLLPKYSFLQV